jgi:hypothetical protein
VRRHLRWLTILVVSAIAARASGGEQPPPKVAVLDLKTTGTFEPKLVLGLSNLIASEAARHPVRVISGADLTSLLGLERQKQLLGCSESSCMAEIGGALGVDYLLVTDVSKVGEVWLFTANLLDVRKARAVARVTERTQDQSRLVDLARAGVERALEPIAAGPAPDGAPAARVAGYVLDGTGAVLLAGGAAFGVWSQLTFDQAKRASSRGEMDDLKDKTNTQMIVADVLYAAGAVALGVGLVLTFTSPSTRGSVSVGVAPSRSGGGLAVSGAF